MRLLMLLILPSALALVSRADVTVNTFQQELHNWATAHVDTFQFPAAEEPFSSVTLHYTLDCPEAPGDCDPWDRLGHLSILVPDGQGGHTRIEIARVITPYDITGSWGPPYGTGPGECGWTYDVSAYSHLLRGDVILSSYIESWIGGDRGWQVTADFEFTSGVPAQEPFAVIPLWDFGGLLIGDPTNPYGQYLHGANIGFPAGTETAELRITTTGHGQGNTDNAAEFMALDHYVLLGFEMQTLDLWRDDCNTNPCSGQGGNWWYGRFNWCPGASVPAWTSPVPVEGDSIWIDYWFDTYLNRCRPTNPDCVSGSTCADCNWNDTGHTPPIYATMGQLVCYRTPALTVGDAGGRPSTPALGNAYPNPFNPGTTLPVSLDRPAKVRLEVYNLLGERVALLLDGDLPAGHHQAAFTGEGLPAGVYIARLEVQPAGGDRGVSSRKLVLAR